MADGRWKVILVRPGAARSLAFEATRLGAAGAMLLAVLLVGGGAFALGALAQRGIEAAGVARLEGEVERLTRENATVHRLAARLDTLEATYRRLQRVMSGDVAASERDIELPRLGGAGGALTPGGDPSSPTLWPLAERGFVTRAFGDTAGAPFGGHVGLDIAVPEGSYVRASGAGRVVESGEHAVYGRFLRLEHGGGLASLYAHNSWVFVGVGDRVERGEVVALSGNTGRSTAPHLHFEIEREGAAVDPMEYLSSAR